MNYAYLILLLVFLQCASLTEDDDPQDLDTTALYQTNGPAVKQKLIRSAYYWEKIKQHIDWTICTPANIATSNSGQKSLLYFHDYDLEFKLADFCKSSKLSPLLAEGLIVIAFARPGFDKSDGSPDFWGERTQAAWEALRQSKAFQETNKQSPIEIFWGTGIGGVWAGFASKSMPELPKLIMENAPVQIESASGLLKDGPLKSYFKRFEETWDDRSIAYDFEGLPKSVTLIYTENDVGLKEEILKEFQESLISFQIDAKIKKYQVMKDFQTTQFLIYTELSKELH